MEININNYLSEDDIKEICVEEVRYIIRKSFSDEKERERVLGNLAYEMVFSEIEKIMPNHHDYLVKKVESILKEKSSLNYLIFKNHYLTEEPQSFAAKLVQETVKNNQDLIKDNVINSIVNHDYNSEIATCLGNAVDELAGNIYKLSETLLSKK